MENGSYRISPGGRFSGFVCENGADMTAIMQKDSVLKIEGDGRGISVSSSKGTLWITQENDLEDHFLVPGEIFVNDRQGLVIVYSLSDASLDIGQTESL